MDISNFDARNRSEFFSKLIVKRSAEAKDENLPLFNFKFERPPPKGKCISLRLIVNNEPFDWAIKHGAFVIVTTDFGVFVVTIICQ